MKLALVFNPFSYKLHEENLRIVQRYFGLFPPLSLAWVAAIPERGSQERPLPERHYRAQPVNTEPASISVSFSIHPGR